MCFLYSWYNSGMLQNLTRRPLLVELFFSAVVVAGLHYVALTFSLYWTTDWFDILMHFLGGAVIGLGAAFVFFTSGYLPVTQQIRNFALILLVMIFSVLVVGLAWEVWELFAGFTDRFNELPDTILDIVMDTLGGIAAFYYVKRKINE